MRRNHCQLSHISMCMEMTFFQRSLFMFLFSEVPSSASLASDTNLRAPTFIVPRFQQGEPFFFFFVKSQPFTGNNGPSPSQRGNSHSHSLQRSSEDISKCGGTFRRVMEEWNLGSTLKGVAIYISQMVEDWHYSFYETLGCLDTYSVLYPVYIYLLVLSIELICDLS